MQIYQNIFETVAVACLGFLFTRGFSPFMVSFFGVKRFAQKPLNCAMCFTWWTGLIHFCWQFGVGGVAFAAIASVVAAYLDRKL